MEFASKNKIAFFEVSAIKNLNLELAMEELANAILSKHKEELQEYEHRK